MWIFLSNSFLSIVADADPDQLLVRARAAGDIERVFPQAVVEMTPHRDYRFRAHVQRNEVAARLVHEAVQGIAYDNFKDSVREQDRHDAYLGVWSVMNRFQEKRARHDPLTCTNQYHAQCAAARVAIKRARRSEPHKVSAVKPSKLHTERSQELLDVLDGKTPAKPTRR